jgi:uncharacterized protein YcfJ
MKRISSLVLVALIALSADAQEMTHVTRNGDLCSDCGTISGIEQEAKQGQSSGAGALIGAVIGGVVGHQFGQGRGRDVGTVVGAVGGGVAGNEAEKAHNTSGASYYRVHVKMDDGSTRTANVATATGLGIGTRVRVVGNNMQILD